MATAPTPVVITPDQQQATEDIREKFLENISDCQGAASVVKTGPITYNASHKAFLAAILGTDFVSVRDLCNNLPPNTELYVNLRVAATLHHKPPKVALPGQPRRWFLPEWMSWQILLCLVVLLAWVLHQAFPVLASELSMKLVQVILGMTQNSSETMGSKLPWNPATSKQN